jgi:hypothetical protein
MELKYCPHCKTEKSISEFVRSRSSPDGLTGWCWICHNASNRESTQRQRRKLIEALGGRCARCGYNEDWRAFQIDHIGGNGSSERRTLKFSPSVIRSKVLANPKNYALLCANCNQIKRIENLEHRQSYTRIPPTERIHGIGRGNAPGSKCALNNWRARATEKQKSMRLTKWRAARHARKKMLTSWARSWPKTPARSFSP